MSVKMSAKMSANISAKMWGKNISKNISRKIIKNIKIIDFLVEITVKLRYISPCAFFPYSYNHIRNNLYLLPKTNYSYQWESEIYSYQWESEIYMSLLYLSWCLLEVITLQVKVQIIYHLDGFFMRFLHLIFPG